MKNTTKFYLLAILTLSILLLAIGYLTQRKEATLQVMPMQIDSLAVQTNADTAYDSCIEDLPEVYSDETAFPCWVDHIEDWGNGETAYITECGITFQSKKHYKVGDTIPHFNSPKHKCVK